MPAIGMGMAWGGYAVWLWGYCLIKGYNLSFGNLVSPAHYYTGPWPPAATSGKNNTPAIPDTSVLPTGTSSSTQTAKLA